MFNNSWSSDTSITCSYCGEKYESITDYLNDCFNNSNDWSSNDNSHNCFKYKGLESN